MEDHETRQYSSKKRIRQPPSVPFLWEIIPGIAKKGWKPWNCFAVSPSLSPPSPLKLIASVPFNWEQEPGKPLSSFSLTGPEIPQQPLVLSLPPVCHHECHDDSNSSEDEGDSSSSEESFETDYDSFSSAPSLQANSLVAYRLLSTTIPSQKSVQDDHLEAPLSPGSESDSSTSSYATGSSSLVGASFLERLFPLLPPKNGFLGRVEYPAKGAQALKWSDQESMTTAVTRRPLTLGELIMMSRRRSCQRKAVQNRKQKTSMVILNLAYFSVACLEPQFSIMIFWLE